MNRPKQHQLKTNPHPAETLGVRAEDVLPEHMLLRFLCNSGIVDDDKPVDTAFAVRVAAMIAASEAFEGPTGQMARADEDGTEAGTTEEDTMTEELDPSRANQEALDAEQLEEAEAIAAEATTELAVNGEALPEAADTDEQPTEEDEEEVMVDVGELLADVAVDDADEAAEATEEPPQEPQDCASEEPIAAEEPPAVTEEENDLGALVADAAEEAEVETASIAPEQEQEPEQDPAPEQEQEQAEAAAVADEPEIAEPVAEEVAEEITTDEPAFEEPVAEELFAEEPPFEDTPSEEATTAEFEAPSDDIAEAAATEAEAPTEVEATVEAEAPVEAEAEADVVAEPAAAPEVEATDDEPVVEMTPHAEAQDAPEAPAASDDEAADQVTEAAEIADETTATPAETTEPADAVGEEFALTNGTMDKVQDFLSELKGALVQMAQRPPETAPAPEPAAPIDVEPLMNAMQQGFEKSAQQAEQANSAVASLSEHMAQLGSQLEGGMSRVAGSLATQPIANPVPATATAAPDYVEDNGTSQAVVLGAVSLVVLGWSIIFWIKTGSPKLALGTLIGANVIACCMLLKRGTRS